MICSENGLCANTCISTMHIFYITFYFCSSSLFSVYRTFPLNDPRLNPHKLPRPSSHIVHHAGSSDSIRGMLPVPGGGGGGDPDPGFRMLERLPVVNKGTCTSMHRHNIIMFLLTIRNSNSYVQALPIFIGKCSTFQYACTVVSQKRAHGRYTLH